MEKTKEKIELKQKNQKEKGITLIALVVTIVVLLILAGVSISMLTGENGIITQAQEAKEKTEEEQLKEEIKLAYNTVKVGSNLKGWDLDTEIIELQKELTNNNKVDNILVYRGKEKDGNDVIIVEYTNREKTYCIRNETTVNRCDVKYKLGELKKDTIEIGEYAIICATSSTTSALCNDLEYEEVSLNEGEELKRSMIWRVEKSDEGILIYLASGNTKKYINCSNTYTANGYRLGLSESEFYWNESWNSEKQAFRVFTKTRTGDTLNIGFYNSKLGWIATTTTRVIQFGNVYTEISILD